MHIIVLVKQVPNTSEVRLDPKTGNLIREGVESIINPEDRHALEAAVPRGGDRCLVSRRKQAGSAGGECLAQRDAAWPPSQGGRAARSGRSDRPRPIGSGRNIAAASSLKRNETTQTNPNRGSVPAGRPLFGGGYPR